MIVGTEVGGCDLVPAADGQAQAMRKVQSSNDQARSYKVLLFAVARSILKKCGVQLYLGPKQALRSPSAQAREELHHSLG